MIAKLMIEKTQLDLLEKLCNAVAVSGGEGEVRRIIIDELTGIADDISVDALGNVLVKKLANPEVQNPINVMLDAHMDEVGFMIAEDEGNGIYALDRKSVV